MTMRHLVSRSAAVAAVFASTIVLTAQTRTPATYTQPKTAWGDPDIQGVWTSDAARGIPRERPAKFGNRAMLTDEEFADKVKADAKTRQTAENAIGSFRNDGAWLNKSFRQTSLIVEPEDGHTPAFTEQALKRAAPRDR